MKWRALVLTVSIVSIPAASVAHVTVEPRESKPSIDERYTMRVPSQGTSPTVSVELFVPDGVTILTIAEVRGGRYEVAKDGEIIKSIKWTKEIPLWQYADFIFVARNPAAGQIPWKSHEHYADGREAEWTTITRIIPPPVPAEAVKIQAWLREFESAFNAKDLERLGTFYHPGATITEDGHISSGWVAYRDERLAPQLKALDVVAFARSSAQIHLLGDTAAYVVSTYTLKGGAAGGGTEGSGVETLVIVKEPTGNWRIRHRQTSSAGGGDLRRVLQ